MSASNTTGLRQRRGVAHASTNGTNGTNGYSNPKKKEPLTPGLRGFLQRHWTWFLAIPAYALYGAYFYSLKQQSTHSDLPETYILCSPRQKNVYTVDAEMSRVQCIGVNGTVIFERGLLVDILARLGDKRDMITVRTIAPGSIIVPGMSDSHAHILEHGASLVIPLNQAKNAAEAVQLVVSFIQSTPEIEADPDKLIEGWGWDHMSWPDQAWPTSADFDLYPTLRNRKIVLQSKDGHALWVSPAVLASIHRNGEPLADIEGGVLTRTLDGQPAGVFIDKAQDIVPRDEFNDDDLRRRFLAAVHDGHSKGLTSIHDAGFSPVSLEFFKREATRAPLPVRVYGMMYFNESTYWGDTMPKVIDYGRLTARSVKMFADGALRSGYAALHEPYSDNEHTHGVMRITPEILNDVVPQFFADGWQVNVHAIGDRANGIVLDAFQAALKGRDVKQLRPRLEHAQILTKADINRIASLGLIASIQPTHAISDMAFAEQRLGPERAKGIYAFQSLLDAGARLTFGSDSPVEDLSPIKGFYAAITRLSPDGNSPHGPDGWFADQRLTREDALRGITIEPAYASFTEDVLGSLEIGKRADFVVLSQNIMEVAASELLWTTVEATVIDGKLVYGKI